jgi:UDP-glucuronate 4-epimerase
MATYADTSELERDIGFKPATPLKTGLQKFVEWYKIYHGV